MSQMQSNLPGSQACARGTLRRLSVAPMMDRTDRHFRVMMRTITRRVLLYSEMVTTSALIHGDRARLLDFSACEKPLSLQLGGDDPVALSTCARLAETWGYDEVNLNVGCPSERVRKGSFGACLMARADVVARAIDAMRNAVALPVTVKHRIGIDGLDRYEDMLRFVDTVASAGCDRFTVHARVAVLGGLSPKQNRTVPPLRYADVHRLKRERPQLVIELNGGIGDLAQVHAQLAEGVDAVMVGRAAYDDPLIFAHADAEVFGERSHARTAFDVVEAMANHLEAWLSQGGRASDVLRPMMGLFNGRPGARQWRRLCATPHGAVQPRQMLNTLLNTLQQLREWEREDPDHSRDIRANTALNSTLVDCK